MKIRLRYRREGKIRFISHRDTARIMERAFRKLRLPIAYTEGFSPRPKVSFGLALTVAYESDAEFLDIDLVTPVELEDLPHRLTQALPDGLFVDAVAPVEHGAVSLQQAIVRCGWLIEVLGDVAGDELLDDVTHAVAAVLAAPECPLERERKGKISVTDVRPAILELRVLEPTGDGVQLRAVLATETLTIRPSEVIRVLNAAHGDERAGAFREGRVRRTHQWTYVDGVEQEPVSLRSPVRSAELAGMRDS